MGRKFAPTETSEYYPPRARWYAALFSVNDSIRRRLHIERLALPREITVPGFVAALLIPGMGIHLRGSKLWARPAFASCAALLLAYIIWLGYPMANLALGVMMSIHSSGFVYYCNPLFTKESFRFRMFFSLAASMAVLFLIYLPIKDQVQSHFFTPLRLDGQVIVVSKAFTPRLIVRGNWVAYSLRQNEETDYANRYVHIHNGTCLGEVLAMPGDTVAFAPGKFSVNGNWRPSLPHMPKSGDLTVAENRWFIWPNLAINGGHGNVSQADIASAVLNLASVAPEQYIGRPFHRWFWRRQGLT